MSLMGFLCFNVVCDWISSIFNGGRAKPTTISNANICDSNVRGSNVSGSNHGLMNPGLSTSVDRSASRQDIDAFDRIDELQSRIDDLEDQLLETDIESERYDEIEDQIFELESEIDDWNDFMIDDY